MPTAKRIDLLTRQENDGRISSALFHQNTDAIHTQIRSILNATLNAYAKNDLTQSQALSKIGEIYSLRKFLEDLDTKIARGKVAAEEKSNG